MKLRNNYLFAVIALLTAASCTTKPIQPRFDVLSIDTLVGTPTAEYKIEYSFATIANAAECPAMQAIEQANINHFFGLEEFTGSAHEAMVEAIERIHREAEETSADSAQSGYTWKNSEQARSEAVVVDTLLVYTISTYNFSGGAHGISGFTARNYSLSGGYELSLSDLFTQPQQEALGLVIRSKLYDHFNVSGDEGLIEQGFFPELICTTENFAVTPDGLTFYYNPYDIGCYALGNIQVHISKQELENLR